MVDILRASEGREYSRLPFECARPYAASRRSSISSRAESEASVFSETSVASSQSSVSIPTSSVWDSSTQFDSDEEGNTTVREDSFELEIVPDSAKPVHLNLFSALKAAGSECNAKEGNADGEEELLPTNTSAADTDELKTLLSRVSVRRDASAPTTGSLAPNGTADKSNGGCPFVRPLHPSQTAQNNHRTGPVSSHPRRTVTDPNWRKPSLVSQDERRLNFVENLVDTATALVALIWPASVNPVFPDGQQQGTQVISLRFFIRETLRRSRTSFSTLQVAMYYLALVNFSGNIPKCDFSKEQATDNLSGRALQCGRRMFLASLILASKYLQDRNYFTKAWSRISNLSVAEINRNEMALLGALDYKLHIKATEFQKWTDCISKCTASVQRGMKCPWREGLACMSMWRDAVDLSQPHGLHAKRPLCPAELRRSGSSIPALSGATAPTRASTLPAHRLSLLHTGQSVCPTRPRPCIPVNGDLHWPGMAAHLSSTTRTVPQFSASPESLTVTESRNLSQSAQGGTDLPLSPPKTPSPRSQDIEMREEDLDLESVTQDHTPPPAPREPLVSLNTTPESNDGASTFGNYLAPITHVSGQETLHEDGQPPQPAHAGAARLQADTLAHDGGEAANEDVLPELDSRSRRPSADSFDLPLSTSRLLQSAHPQKDVEFKHHALDVAETTFNTPEQNNTVVVPDEKVAAANTDVEVAARHLMRKETSVYSHGSATRSSVSPVVETFTETANPTPAVDGIICRRASKKCRSQKQTHCHRKKRGPSCFSGGLADRTSKAMRV